jgi:hypothetical protein
MSTNANYYYYAAAAATAIAGILHTVVFKYNRKKSYDRSVLSNRRISTTILDNTHDKEMGKNLVLYRNCWDLGIDYNVLYYQSSKSDYTQSCTNQLWEY